jgi:hypothetical protein
MTWKASLPKGLPDAGRIQFIFAIKTVTGYRVEYSGTCDEGKGLEIYKALMEAGETPAKPQ